MTARLTGRPREFDEAEVLSRAIRAFWLRGYDGTSVADLVEAMGIQKGSLYGAFEDKRHIYLRAVELYQQDLVVAASAALLPGDKIEVRLRSFLEGAIARAESGDRRGCFLCNAAIDRAAADADVEAIVRRGLTGLEQVFRKALRDLVDPTVLDARAQLLLSSYVGLQALARAGYALDSLRTILTETLRSTIGPSTFGRA
ncbi:MAG: TetR/AcrR family transcriptional regulator [Bauldia sp.]